MKNQAFEERGRSDRNAFKMSIHWIFITRSSKAAVLKLEQEPELHGRLAKAPTAKAPTQSSWCSEWERPEHLY